MYLYTLQTRVRISPSHYQSLIQHSVKRVTTIPKSFLLSCLFLLSLDAKVFLSELIHGFESRLTECGLKVPHNSTLILFAYHRL